MPTLPRSRSWLLVFGCSLLFAPGLGAQPAKKKVATQADIERLDKKLVDQQQRIDKLVEQQVRLQKVITALIGGEKPEGTDKPATEPGTDPPPPGDAKPPGDTPAKPPEKVVARPEPRPVAPKPKPAGNGTVVGKITGATDAIIYIEDIVASTKGTAAMKQEGKQFSPQVLVVQKGTKVDFPNRDAIFHNVFSMSPDNTFDLGSYPQGDSKSVTMSRPGVVTVYCNMHPQMVGHILVVPNGNYVRAGKDGFFRLPNVPAGKHRVVAWAPNAKPVVTEATITDGEVVTLELGLTKRRSGPHTKKDGLPYGSYDQ